MISGFTLKNMTSGKEASFGQEVSDDFLYHTDGLEWGSAPAAHNTYSYQGQVGESISSTKINSREVAVTGYVFYVLTDEEIRQTWKFDRDAYAYEKIKAKKRFLNEVMNPNDYIRLTIGSYYIEGKPEASIAYGNTDANNNIYFCEFTFSLLCANPMFKKVSQVKTVLAGEEPMFHFPWIIPEEGYVMSVRTAYSLLTVENEGDVPVGGKITLTALGEVENPTVENIGTGEEIKILKTMQKGESIVIDTTDGPGKGIKGIIGGQEMNYFKYWSINNTWFKFQQGTCLIGYSTDNASDSLLQVSVEINPEKFALEEM